MRAKTRTSGRRIGLNGIALIEQVLVVKLLEQPPERFDVSIVVRDVGVLQIDPITHTVSQVSPLLGKLHHILAAGRIVLGHRDALADVLLGNTEGLLHSQLYRQSVSIPSGLTLHLESLHRLVTTEDVLD